MGGNNKEVKQHLNLSEAEIDAQLTPLMYSELVKERSEGTTFTSSGQLKVDYQAGYSDRVNQRNRPAPTRDAAAPK